MYFIIGPNPVSMGVYCYANTVWIYSASVRSQKKSPRATEPCPVTSAALLTLTGLLIPAYSTIAPPTTLFSHAQ